MNSAYCTQRNGQPRKGISRFSSGKCFAGDRENLDYTTSSIPTAKNHNICRRQINVDRVSFDGGGYGFVLMPNLKLSHTQHGAGLEALSSLSKPDKISSVWATFKANLYGRCRGQMIGHRTSDQSGANRRTRPQCIYPSDRSVALKKSNGGFGGRTLRI